MKVNSNIQLCFIGTHIDLHVPRNGHDELNSVKCVETDELCTARLESFMPFISQRVSCQTFRPRVYGNIHIKQQEHKNRTVEKCNMALAAVNIETNCKRLYEGYRNATWRR